MFFSINKRFFGTEPWESVEQATDHAMQSNMNKEVKSTSLSAFFFVNTFRIKKQNISDNLKIPVESKIVLYMFFFNAQFDI